MNYEILKLDKGGVPQGWITPQDAAGYYATDDVVWTIGEPFMALHGGFNRPTGKMSVLDLHPVIAIRGIGRVALADRVPTLTNRALFARDRHLCMYCGQRFTTSGLTRDHVVAKSRGGLDEWTNCVSACRFCNASKGAKLLSECCMQLLATPTVPSFIGGLLLSRGGKRILGDQLSFLEAHLPDSQRGKVS